MFVVVPAVAGCYLQCWLGVVFYRLFVGVGFGWVLRVLLRDGMFVVKGRVWLPILFSMGKVRGWFVDEEGGKIMRGRFTCAGCWVAERVS